MTRDSMLGDKKQLAALDDIYNVTEDMRPAGITLEHLLPPVQSFLILPLFALFKAKPSPFCILDEVDAPLDDANVLRFARTLQEMSSDTQFLVITHNKLTMEAASTLYGVTMEEKGVSKLVGVDVDNLHPSGELAAS